MRTKTKALSARRAAAATVALGACLTLAAPAGAASAQPSDPVPTVFFGDSYTADFGIAPPGSDEAPLRQLACLQAKENYPTVATRQLKAQGVSLDVRSDRSCGGALTHHFWSEQKIKLPFPYTAPPQQNALNDGTKLVAGGMGGNTLGFAAILKQCSDRLRGPEGDLLPSEAQDPGDPAERCRDHFERGDGKAWLEGRFERVEDDLDEMLERIGYFAPNAETVLVGYPRIVPEDASKCREPAPGEQERPLADIREDALEFLDEKVQQRLNEVMRRKAKEYGETFVDLYSATGGNTACDGARRGIGGLLENSQYGAAGGRQIPWFVHPNPTGRDLQARHVADAIKKALAT
ncbi:SGNH/GDSL hydrolase family protein [Streptomyces marispadix]|uniref:SGNH/GDSL hydrolase family protein n=1 Tax=Streptomyces marispadix TaxID=2922868 RepID=A0ABS9T153_9ACTN|nr:SGNH/GDSL hydrolase family protein [Streptomyces marispadix]MCH6162266.1 SGNH/GDSL hydrolase family protein [Streptomyces marispadix]